VTTDAVDRDRGRNERATGDDRWFLNDEREFLLRSIDDAERERAAGDLSDADSAVLTERDRTRLAEVEAELAALGPEQPVDATPSAPETAPRRRYGPWSRVGIVVACLLIVAGAGILVNHAVNPAVPGQASSGSVTLSKAQRIEDQLIAASELANEGNGASALELYNDVLTEDPNDGPALAAGGWLEWNAGRADRSQTAVRAGRASEEKAIAVAPDFYGGHLFLGLILLEQDHNASGAITQFTAFLADDPPADEVASYASQVAPAYAQERVPLPTALAKATASTTTTTLPFHAPIHYLKADPVMSSSAVLLDKSSTNGSTFSSSSSRCT